MLTLLLFCHYHIVPRLIPYYRMRTDVVEAVIHLERCVERFIKEREDVNPSGRTCPVRRSEHRRLSRDYERS